MIFLTKATTKDIFYTIPQARQNTLNTQTRAYIQNMQQQPGNNVHFYTSPEGALYSIGKYSSLQIYRDGLWGAPRAHDGFTNFECIPLLEVNF
jgi:hypothetical protein